MKYVPYLLFSLKLIFCRALLLLNLATAAALPIDPPDSHWEPPPRLPSRPPPLVESGIVGIPQRHIDDFVGAVLWAGAFAVVAAGLTAAPMLLYNATQDKEMQSRLVATVNYALDGLYSVGDKARYSAPVGI